MLHILVHVGIHLAIHHVSASSASQYSRTYDAFSLNVHTVTYMVFSLLVDLGRLSPCSRRDLF